MDCVQISDKFKDRLLPSATAFTVDLASCICISIAHQKQSMFLLRAFSCIFFTQKWKI